MKNRKQTITEYQCPFCDKIIASLSQAQAEYNYGLHRDACKRRLKKEDERGKQTK